MELELSQLIDALPDLVWSGSSRLVGPSLSTSAGSSTGVAPRRGRGIWLAVRRSSGRSATIARTLAIVPLSSGQPGEVASAPVCGVSTAHIDRFLFRASGSARSGGLDRQMARGAMPTSKLQTCAWRAVAASERDLRSIIDTIPTTAWTAPSGRFLRLPESALARLRRHDRRSRRSASGVGRGDPSSRPRMGLSSTGSRVWPQAHRWDAEARMLRYDGAYRWFLFRANPLREQSREHFQTPGWRGGRGVGRSSTTRLTTRRTLVSSTTSRCPYAKLATADAVQEPTPGRLSSVARSAGTSPPKRSVIMPAAWCSRRARRGWPESAPGPDRFTGRVRRQPARSWASAPATPPTDHRTRSTGVCCSMNSLTSTAHGLTPGRRHGRSRAFSAYQASVPGA